MKFKHIYLFFAVLGVCYTWYYNILWFQTTTDPTFLNFFKEAQCNFAAKSINADLSIVVVTSFALMISESLRLKIKYWWVLLPLTFLIAIAFTFPLFLYLRHHALEKRTNLT